MNITDEMVERAARAMCERDGFKWDAASVMETANGDEPEQQREYWLDKADAALTAALAVQTQQGVEVKGLGWMTCGPVTYAITPFGSYEVRPNGGFTNSLFEVSPPVQGAGIIYVGDDEAQAKAAAQSDYETRIRSALVDVPAVESEPMAWIVREVTPSNGRGPNTIITGNVVPRGYEAITPLFAHPPRSLSNEGEIVAAAQRYVDAVNGEPEKDCWDTEDGNPAEGAERFASDWAWKAYDEKKQQAFDTLRLTLSTRKGSAGDGSATGTKDADHG